MEDILADSVLNTIRDRYYAGVTQAENFYKYNRADEDAITGALGQSLVTPSTRVRDIFGNEFFYSIYHHKIRGRGHNAPEKTLGADGIFQIEVFDRDGVLIRRKGLLFQSKKEWTGTDPLLGEQAEKLTSGSDSEKAVIIDFNPARYQTCTATVAALAQGDKNKIDKDKFSNLSSTLGDEFLRCRIGLKDLYYDESKELLFDPTINEDLNLVDRHVVGTRVQTLT